MSVPLLSLTGTSLLVLLLGVTLLVGFGADWLANRFRVPDVLWLIGLGIIAGPILGLLGPSSLLVIAPVLGATTIVLILFDAGIDLQITEVRPYAGSALLFALGSYFASALVLFLAGYLFLFPGHPLLSVLFATALACTSGAVIIPLAQRLGLGLGLRNFLQLDAAFEDAIAVVVVTTILALRLPTSASLAFNVVTSLALPLPVGVALGLAGGLVWLLFLYGWQSRPFAALATLGFLFVLYAAAEALGGSGILAALVFGFVLGNERFVRKLLRRTRPFRISNELRRVEVEIAFLLRAFFLFLIGMLVVLVYPGPLVSLTVVGLVVVLLAVRRALFRATTRPTTVPRLWGNPVTAFSGRGLTSAVLLILAAEVLPSVTVVFFAAILLIVGTDAAMTLWLFVQPVRPGLERLEREAAWAEVSPHVLTLAGNLPPLPEVSVESPPTGGASGSEPPEPQPRAPPPLPGGRKGPRP